MGKIKGDVDSVGIASILQMLSLSGSQGTLSVRRLLKKKRIEFGPSGMRMLASGAGAPDPLEDALLRSGAAPGPDLERLAAEARKTGVHLGALLVERGLLPGDELRRIHEDRIAEEIYDLFTWTGATFEWKGELPRGPSPEGGAPPALAPGADPASVLLQASRLADELARIHELIPDMGMVPFELAELPVPGRDWRTGIAVFRDVLPRLDGRRSVDQLIRESGAHKFQVLSAIYELVLRGSVELREKNGASPLRKPGRPGHSATAPRGGAPVLLLSADPAFAAPIADRLRSAGYEVRQAGPEPTLEDLGGARPARAVVLDALVDTDPGLRTALRLKETTGVPVLAFAGAATSEAVDRAAGSGARVVFLRPLKEEPFLERLADLVRE